MLPDDSGLYGGSGAVTYDPEAFAKANSTGLLASGMADLSPVASAKAHSVGGERRAVRGTENLLPDAQTLSVFEEAAVRYQVPVNALLAIGHQETRFDASRVGPMTKYGQAVGMMQYIPSTAKALGIDPRDTRQSVFAAAMEMRQRIDRGLSVPDAIAAHFAGDNVAQWGEKTRAYRQEVTAKAKAIAGLYKSLHRERSEMAVEHERLFNQAENFKRQPASKEKPSASVQQQPSSGEKRPSLAEQAGRDFARGVDNLQSLGYGLAAAVGDVAGLDDVNRWGLEGYLRNKKEAAQNPAVIGTYQNVKSFDDAVRYGIEALAENAASIVPTLGTGGVGGFVAKKIAEKSVTNLAGKALASHVAKRSAQGATAAMVPTSVGMSTGGIYGDIYEQTGEKRPGVAVVAGTVAGSLDAIPQLMAIKKAFGPVVAEALQGHVLGRLGKTAGMQFLSEGATEVAQTLIEQGAVRYVDGKPYWNEGLFHQVVDGFLKGGVSGGAMGVASQGVAEVRGRGVKPTPSTAEPSSADASTAEMVEPSVADSGPKDSDLLRRMGIEVDEPTPNVPVPMSQVQAEAGRVPPVSENPVSGGPEITRVIDIAPDGEASIRFQAGQPISGLLPLQQSSVVVDAEGRVGGLSEVQNAGLDARLAELNLPRALDPSLDTPTGITAGKHPGYTPESLLKALDDVRNEVSQVVVPELEMRRSGLAKVDIERDDALTAIAKLGGIDVAQVQSEYGNTITDEAKRVNRGSLFGKPVFRREGGLSLDDMAHALSEYGYLGQDEHGKVDIGGLYDILSSDGPVYHPVAQEKLAQSQMAAAARDEMLRPESILSMAQQRLLADGFVEAEGAEVSQSDAVIDSSGQPSVVSGDVAVVADDGGVSVPVGSGARTETFADLFARGEIDVPEDDPILLSRSAGRGQDSGLADGAVDTAGPDGEVDSFGVSSDEIEAALASELAAFRSGRSDVKVVDYEDDLPASIQRQLLQGGISGVEGLWDPTRNQVYLIGENIQDVDRAREVLMHEVVGHASMEEMLGKELMDRFVHRVTRMSLAGNRFAAEAAAWVDKTQPDLPPEIRAREIVAVMAERGYRSADDTLMNRVFEAIRQFLRRAGFKADWVTRISDADIYRLLRDADRFAKTPRGEVVAVNPASTLFSVGGPRQKILGYKTAKGSKYIVHEDGTTTRDKARRNDPDHEGDFGVKERTQKTIYVEHDASLLSAAGLNGIGDKGARVIIRDGKASLIIWNNSQGRWGISPMSRDIPIYDAPAIGRYPLELWKKKDDIPGYDAYAGMHAGNKIVEVIEDSSQQTASTNIPKSTETTTKAAARSQQPVSNSGLTNRPTPNTARPSNSPFSGHSYPAQNKPSGSGNNGPTPNTARPPGGGTNGPTTNNASAGFNLPQPQGKGAKWKRGARRLREVNQDRYIRVKEVQDAVVGQGGTLDDKSNVYQAETLSHGRKLALSEDFQATEVLPLLRDVGRAGVELDDVALLAYALHAPERNAQIAKINPRYPDGGSGMTNADAQQKVDFLRDKYGDKFAELEQFVGRLQGIARKTSDYMVEAGLIDSNTAATWQGVYQSYVPLKGFEQIDEDTGQAVQPAAVVDSGKVGNVRGAESKRAMGRGSLAGQIIENVIADRLRAINRAENNRVGKVLLQFVLDNPDANLWVADMFQKGAAGKWGRVIGPNGQVSLRNTLNVATDPEVFTVKVGGREIHIRLKDRQLAEALSGVHDEKQMGWVLDTLSAANRYLAAVFTGYNPTFTVVNGIRDTQGAFFQNLATFGFKGAAKGVVYAARALPTAFKMNFAMDRAKQVARGQNGLPTDWEGYYREMRANGGLTGFMDFRTLTQIGEDAARQVGVAAGNKRAQFKQVGLGVLKAIENANAAIESVNRLAAFRIARENGFSPEKAAAIAKDVTVNFNRRGSQRKASAWFLFFNPAIQGTERFVHAMKHPKVASAAVAMAASAALLAAFSAEALGEDEDGRPIWDKIPESDKSRNLIVPTGVSGAYAKVPLPYGWNVFAVLGVGLVDVLRNRDDPARGMDPARAAGWMATSAVDSFNPVGGSRLVGSAGAGGMLDAMLPAVLQPFSQNIRNENGFGNQLSPTPMYGQKVAKSEQYFPSMEGTGWQVFSSWLNEATGGNAAEDGLVSVRPAELKNAVTFFGGGSLRFVTDIMEALSAEENGWQQAPMLRQLSGADNARNDSRLFYEGLDRVESKHQAYQAFREAGNERLMAEIERDFGPYIALGEAVDVYKGRLSELRGLEARARAQNDAKTRENLALIGQEKLRVMRAFNVEFDRAIRAVEGQ